jgi:hypothetical protein
VQIYKKDEGPDKAEKIPGRVSNPRVGNPVKKCWQSVGRKPATFYHFIE